MKRSRTTDLGKLFSLTSLWLRPLAVLGLYVSQETANGEFVARWSVGQDETGREIMEAAQSAA